MRLRIFLTLLFLVFIHLSCLKKEVDTTEVDRMLKTTDSLLQELSAFQAQLVDSVYHLSGKKLISINPNSRLTPKDSLNFYQLLQEISATLKDVFQYSQKEILFSLYQLESIKDDIINEGKISNQLLDEINIEAGVLKLLEQRVDSSILIMNESVDQIYLFLGDTLSLTLISDSIK
jgi:hypothetical protein